MANAATCAIIALLILSCIGALALLLEINSNQIQQAYEVAFIKKEQIRAKTIAEMKQNELNLIT